MISPGVKIIINILNLRSRQLRGQKKNRERFIKVPMQDT